MPRQTPRNTVRRSAVKQMRREETQRKTRQTRLFAVLAGVVVLSIIAVLVLIRANRPETPATAAGDIVTVPTRAWTEADGKAIGPADAAVVLKEFADFQCPFCKRFNQTVQPQIIEQYVDTGKVRYEYHHFIIIDSNVGGTESRRAAEASECASQQNRFWDFHETVYANQAGEGSGALADSRLKAFAESIGLDMQSFNACFDSGGGATAVTIDDATARSAGLNGTPALLVNGKVVSNPMDFNTVKAAIDAALAGAE